MITLKILFIFQFLFYLCLFFYLRYEFYRISRNICIAQSIIAKNVNDFIANYLIRLFNANKERI